MDTADLKQDIAAWLHAFAEAVTGSDMRALTGLMDADAYWRDVLALSWDLHTFYGIDQIRSAMTAALPGAAPSAVVLDEAEPPRHARRAGREVVEVIFRFETTAGACRGVAALVPGQHHEGLRCWTLLTALDRLAGPADPATASAGSPPATRDFAGPNWRDLRIAAARYDDHDPAVVIVGAGQAGLAVAARLRQLGVDALIVDRMERIGDNWRTRYHSLVLHNETWANHLPYLPFPGTWPVYIPKDLLADWFEAYATFMELNVWTGTEFVGGDYDPRERIWSLRVRRPDGTERVLKPRHVVMASGVSSIPYRPQIAGLPDFAGEVLHTSDFVSGERFAGRRVTVIGTGTSGHDVAQDLWSNGAEVTLVQRSPSTVVSVGPDAAGKVYSLYRQGRPTEVTDLINISIPYPVLRQSYQLLTRELAEQDAGLLGGLAEIGFRIDYGSDNTGFQMKYLRKGGGYYLNVGCSELLVTGKIKLLQFAEIARFAEAGAILRSGDLHPADVVILATGYDGQQEVVRQLFGDAVAERVGPIWGYDGEGELRNMWRRTGQEGLWFTAGSLAQCRIFSKYLALQIKACEAGLLTTDRAPGEAAGAIRDADLADLWSGPGTDSDPLPAAVAPPHS